MLDGLIALVGTNALTSTAPASVVSLSVDGNDMTWSCQSSFGQPLNWVLTMKAASSAARHAAVAMKINERVREPRLVAAPLRALAYRCWQ